MNEAVYNVLKRVRTLLTDRAKWTQGVLARNEDGVPIDPMASDAACWCLGGAIRHVSPTTEVARAVSSRLNHLAAADNFTLVNDRGGYKATMNLLDDAIAAEAADPS